MGIWHFNPPEPCCNPATRKEIKFGETKPFGGEDVAIQGLQGVCGNCKCVPSHWKLTVPPDTFFTRLASIDASPGNSAKAAKRMNGEHILTREFFNQTFPAFPVALDGGFGPGPSIGNFNPCSWIWFVDISDLILDVRFVGIELAYGNIFGAGTINSKWSLSTVPRSFDFESVKQFDTSTFWLLKNPNGAGEFFHCLGKNEFPGASDQTAESDWQVDHTKKLTIEPYYP